MVAISPKATVPVLQLPDGTVIDESLDIMQWALTQRDPENWLYPDGGSLDEAIAFIEETEMLFKPHLDRYKYPDRYAGMSAVDHRTAACSFIDLLEERLEAMPNLFGRQACLADMAIFPFIRQFANTDSAWFAASRFRRTQAWLSKLTHGTHFDLAMKKYPQWHYGDEVVFFPK